jgi:hypothetical protein
MSSASRPGSTAAAQKTATLQPEENDVDKEKGAKRLADRKRRETWGLLEKLVDEDKVCLKVVLIILCTDDHSDRINDAR